MSITFVYWIRNALANIPAWGFAIGAIIVFVIAALFIQSTSGMAGMMMPILGAIAMALFAGTSIGAEGGQMMLVSAFTVGVNFMASGVYPDATKMGVLELTNESERNCTGTRISVWCADERTDYYKLYKSDRIL